MRLLIDIALCLILASVVYVGLKTMIVLAQEEIHSIKERRANRRARVVLAEQLRGMVRRQK